MITIGEKGAIEPVAPVGALTNGNGADHEHQDAENGHADENGHHAAGRPDMASEITVNEAIEIAKKRPALPTPIRVHA